MGMHQDKEERADAPVVSLSIGDTCVFRFGNTETRGRPYTDVELRSGDLFVFGGPSRWAYHGVPKILPGTSPGPLQRPAEPDAQRDGPVGQSRSRTSVVGDLVLAARMPAPAHGAEAARGLEHRGRDRRAALDRPDRELRVAAHLELGDPARRGQLQPEDDRRILGLGGARVADQLGPLLDDLAALDQHGGDRRGPGIAPRTAVAQQQRAIGRRAGSRAGPWREARASCRRSPSLSVPPLRRGFRGPT